jgi:hypothetical protein
LSKRSKNVDTSQQKQATTLTPIWIQESIDQTQKHQQTLETTTDESKSLLATLKSQTDERLRKWAGEINYYNNAIGVIQTKFGIAIKGFSESNTIVFRWFRKTEDLLVNRLYILSIISVALVLLYGYLAYSIISIPTLVASILFGLTMLGAIYASSRYLRGKMDEHLACVKKTEAALAKDKEVFNLRFGASTVTVGDILENVSRLEQKNTKIDDTMPSFLSSVKHTSELEDLLKRQRQTAANMRSALQYQGVLLTDECEKYLASFDARPTSNCLRALFLSEEKSD